MTDKMNESNEVLKEKEIIDINEALEENEIIDSNEALETNEDSEIDDAVELDKVIEDLPHDLSDFVDNDTPSYVKLSTKYDDIMSSASTMFIVGILGIIFLALVFFKVIPLPISSSTVWLFDSVMGGVFVIFIIAGIVSFMHAKQVKADADVEDRVIKDIQKWSDEIITAELLDKNLDLQQPEELLYFSRADKIKDMIMHEFENTDEALISEMVEEIYQKLYENSEDDV